MLYRIIGMGVRKLDYSLTFLCLVGLSLSIYAYYVELSVESNENISAMCDIGEHMSCTKAFKSEYGKGFGIASKLLGKDTVLDKPNSLLGIIFYCLLGASALSNTRAITIVAYVGTILSNFASLYFAFILIFILHDFCIVCVATYVVNFLNFLIVHKKLKQQPPHSGDFGKVKTN